MFMQLKHPARGVNHKTVSGSVSGKDIAQMFKPSPHDINKMTDKFGMYGHEVINRDSFLQDLNTNNNRITNLTSPSHSMDAATKQWVMQQKKVDTFETRLQQEFNGKVNDFKTILQQKSMHLKNVCYSCKVLPCHEPIHWWNVRWRWERKARKI
ncbi:unnamed protein product [Mytilus coruscus]|uniref:Uncharacterized protein n=1 Tax=Mytilus coruscus TaxID=42192 RepID=A0A6J8BLC1_MYTCO|nr:unnamed protein product [Mytilus coruscus]